MPLPSVGKPERTHVLGNGSPLSRLNSGMMGMSGWLARLIVLRLLRLRVPPLLVLVEERDESVLREEASDAEKVELVVEVLSERGEVLGLGRGHGQWPGGRSRGSGSGRGDAWTARIVLPSIPAETPIKPVLRAKTGGGG